MTARLPLTFFRALLSLLLAGLVFCQGASAAGELVAEPAEVNFGTVAAGEQRSLPLSMRNIGPDPVTLGDAWLVHDEGATVEPFSVDPGSCATVVALEAGAACEMTVTFLAPHQSQGFEAFVVAEGDGVDPAVARLGGQSVLTPTPPLAALVAEPSQIVFPRTRAGSVTAPQQVRVRNTGASAIAVPTVAIVNTHFRLVSNDCPGLLAAGGECAVAVAFEPTERPPRPIGYLTGGVTQDGSVVFGPQDPQTRRHQLAVRLSGKVAPRLPTAMIESRLARISGSIPKVLRGGPRHGGLATFQAPVEGSLRLRVYGWTRKHRVLLSTGAASLFEGERYRLYVSVTGKGRKMLRGSKRTRIRAVLSFRARLDGAVVTRAFDLSVKPPKTKSTEPQRRRSGSARGPR